ncbi:ribosomal protein L17 [Cyathus striatus]|nr:ribosomal protein L17 [Cyathus striatus]
MKHGVAFRKFSRTSSHRMLMLRNLVTSLFEHEQIKTTLPKARDTARLAEKIITLGKRGDRVAHARASAFLLNPSLLPKLFKTFALRYAKRPGGYTRIHKFGNRKGDNAPQAVLELVDNPRDLRWEMTSRAIGWEVLKDKLKSQQPGAIMNGGGAGVQELIRVEKNIKVGGPSSVLRPMTRWNLQKVLKFKGKDASLDLSKKVETHMDNLLATPIAFRTMHEETDKTTSNRPRRKAGHIFPGETRAALDLAHGNLGHRQPAPRSPVFNMLSRKYKKSI